MHARHRGPGNGYRSNAMGMGSINNASRVSPDGSSMRNQGFYNSDNRNFNRGGGPGGGGGFGRGQGRQFHQLQVAQPQAPPPPPPPPPPRKDDILMEAGKLAAEYLVTKGIFPPNALSGKWQIGNLKNQFGDFRSQEGDVRTSAISRLGNGASEISSNRRRNFDEFNNSTGSRNYIGGRRKSDSIKTHGSELNQELGRSVSFSKRTKDSPDMESKESATELQSIQIIQESRKIENPVDSESSLERNKLIDEADAINTTNLPDSMNIINPEPVLEPNYNSVEVKMSDSEAEEVNNENINNEAEKQVLNKDNISSEPMKDLDNQEAINNIEKSEANIEDLPVDSSILSHDSKIVDSDAKIVPPVEEKSSLAYDNGEENSLNVIQVKEENTEISEFGNSSLIFMERGEKRALEVDNTWDGTKKLKEWTPSDNCLELSNSIEKPEESNQKRLLDMSLFPENDENTLFSASFKTCDLNLMEASEVNENHNAKENGKKHIDLTVNKHENYGKDIEVIDLEDDCVKEDKPINVTERRDESVFNGLEDFPNNTHNSNEIPDNQDGYGLMLSELLGNDIPNCSSVTPDMSSLHNDINLHNGEGILGDDDSIYMTLGEIPISFLRSWEQPTQDYGKPF